MDVKRYTATVRSFEKQRGYGFADLPEDLPVAAGHKEDLFIHYSEIAGDGFRYLLPGDKISFLPALRKLGWAATAIEIIGSTHPESGHLRHSRRAGRAGSIAPA